MTLQDQLQAFAQAHGGKLRTGPQPRKPEASSIGRSHTIENPTLARPLSDPWIEFSDDYSEWCRVKRGE
jgi:hypothetical protein